MIRALKPLADQVIVITGATSGVGLATARAAAERGAGVVLVARNEAALRALTQELSAKGARAEGVVADVGDPAGALLVVAAADAVFGSFDTWVNDAATAGSRTPRSPTSASCSRPTTGAWSTAPWLRSVG